MMIANLNIVAKTFAKIAKTFAQLSATIIATRRRHVLILHLEAKYAKMDCKNEIYAKNWVRKTRTAKVNPREKSIVKVNLWSKSMVWSTHASDLVNEGQRSGQRGLMVWSTMTSVDEWTMMSARADVVVMMSLMTSTRTKIGA